MGAQINNSGHVVWKGGGGGMEWDIFYWDGSSTTCITENNKGVVSFHINDSGQVVWEGFGDTYLDIFLWDGSRTIQITDEGYFSNKVPKINNNGHIVWEGFIQEPEHFGTEILYWDGTHITPITNNNCYDGVPQINSSGHVMWLGCPFPDIFYWDGSHITQITEKNDYQHRYPQLNDSGQVVWQDWGGTSLDIFYWDGSRVIQITDNDGDDRLPKINNNGQIVWEGTVSTTDWDYEIFHWDGSHVTQITDNDYHDTNLQINNSDQIVWQGEVRGYEIFFAQQGTDNGSTTTTAEISSTTTAVDSSTTTTTCICPLLCTYGRDSEEVALLRYLRDSVLNQTPEGQELIKLYYQWSPAVVKAMEADEAFKEEVKGVIDGILVLIGE
jgi:hypothetical protein